MKSKIYIRELKNNLKELETNKKDEIIKEIQSYIDESNASYQELCSKFGNAKDLANSYINSEDNIQTKILEKASLSDKILMSMGIIFLILIIGAGYLAYTLTSDEFDYSKYNTNSIKNKVNKKWIEKSNIKYINIEQSKVIFYWGTNKNIEYTCKENNNKIANDTLSIKQSYCYIILPKNNININLKQAKNIYINPNASINIKAEQSNIKIYENNNSYVYEFSKEESEIKQLLSKQSNIKIHGKLYQSNMELYEY